MGIHEVAILFVLIFGAYSRASRYFHLDIALVYSLWHIHAMEISQLFKNISRHMPKQAAMGNSLLK